MFNNLLNNKKHKQARTTFPSQVINALSIDQRPLQKNAIVRVLEYLRCSVVFVSYLLIRKTKGGLTERMCLRKQMSLS